MKALNLSPLLVNNQQEGICTVLRKLTFSTGFNLCDISLLPKTLQLIYIVNAPLNDQNPYTLIDNLLIIGIILFIP